MELPRHIPADLARAIQREQECQHHLASLEHEVMLVHTPSVADSEGNAPLSDELARARADWEEALAERRRLESNHALSDHLERLRQQVVTERSSMSRWERWREERRFRREFG